MLAFHANDIAYRVVFPDYPVSCFVAHFVVMYGRPSAGEQRIFPNNKAELFFNLGDSLQGRLYLSPAPFHLERSVISGVRNTYFSFTPGARFFMAGLRFTLFGFHHLFGVPANQFSNHNFVAGDVWGRPVERVREQLLEAKSYAGLFEVMHRWISDNITSESLRSIQKWMQVESKLMQADKPVHSLLEKVLGYSHKHSIELLKQKTGLTPKTIQKVGRFEWAMQRVSRKNPPDWVGLAHEAGFADQSHFIREFKQFTGFTPGEYLLAKPRAFRLTEKWDEAYNPFRYR